MKRAFFLAATQDPPGSCTGRAASIPFTATVRIRNAELEIDDPRGRSSGPIAPDGSAHLAGPAETYDVLSSDGGRLVLEEVNGGCRFRTVITFDQAFPPLATPTAPTTTLAPGAAWDW